MCIVNPELYYNCSVCCLLTWLHEVDATCALGKLLSCSSGHVYMARLLLVYPRYLRFGWIQGYVLSIQMLSEIR